MLSMKEIRVLILSCFVFLLCSHKVYGQKVLIPEIKPPDVRFDNYLTMNGKAMHSSYSVFQDSKGFIWSGTMTGLYRFDGIRYTEYPVNNDDNTGLSGYPVEAIFEDSDGYIWAGTASALNRLDIRSGTFKHYSTDSIANKLTPNSSIRLIKEDSEGLLWIFTNGDYFSFDRDSGVFTRFPVGSIFWHTMMDPTYYVESHHFLEDNKGRIFIASDDGLWVHDNNERTKRTLILPIDIKEEDHRQYKVNCVIADRHGNIWCGTDSEGLNRIIDPEKKIIKKTGMGPGYGNKKINNSVTALLADTSGYIWIFGSRVFSKYNPATGEAVEYIISSTNPRLNDWNLEINHAFQDDSGNIWFISLAPGAVFRFDPESEKLSLYMTPRYITFQCIRERSGALWFACVADNLFRMETDPKPFSTLPIDNKAGLVLLRVMKIIEDRNSTTWLLLNNRIKYFKKININMHLDPETFIFRSGDSTATCIFQDSKGNLWFGGVKGDIIRYNPSDKKEKTFKLPVNKKPGIITSIIEEDNSGDLWFATWDGLFRMPAGSEEIEYFFSYDKLPGKDTEQILSDFLCDSEGNMWIATLFGLFMVEKKTGKINIIPDYMDFGKYYGNWPLRIHEFKNGNILILNCIAGVLLYNSHDQSIKNIRISENRIRAYYDLIIDRSGRFWIAHSVGITIYDPGKNSSEYIPLAKVYPDICGYQLSSGNVIFINGDQLLVFNETLPLNSSVPPVYLTRLLINQYEYNNLFPDEKDIAELKMIKLNHLRNNLSFEFAALNFNHPEFNRYRYFMRGIDIDTIETTTAEADYKKMAPGQYTFWFTGSNNDGVWNKKGTSLEIQIRPPWYSSIIAYSLYALALLSSITIYMRWRISHLKREKFRLEAEVIRRTSELEKKNRQIEEMDGMKTRFFTNISHEIRTPLSLILGPLDYLLKEHTGSEHETIMYETMQKSGDRLMKLINQLLDISKLDSGKMKIVLAKDDIIKCLKILVYEFLSLAESKNIKYIADIQTDELITFFDRDKIEKIVSNLLSNAFKFTPANGTIWCNINIIRETDDNSRIFLLIDVRDNGPGISTDNIPRIFERFYRIEDSFEKNGMGTGIGLSLTREFVTMLHGTIEVKSKPVSGAEFIVKIPLGLEHLSEDEYIITASVPEGKHDTMAIKDSDRKGMTEKLKHTKEKTRVLVIEDNYDLRDFIKNSLGQDYAVIEAEDGRTGLNLAFTMIPDIIITDLMMPGLDGITLCKRLKNDEHTSHIPVIMLTAKATADDKIEGLKSGADDYLVKPFNMAELTTRILNLLEQRKRLRLKYSGMLGLGFSPDEIRSVDDRFIEKTLMIINENLKDFDFDAGSLHTMLGMSRVHCYRKIKGLTGISPGILIRNIRLEHGADLLLKKAGNITEIANSVGISNPSYFTRAFKNYFGISPKNYIISRKENRS